MTDRLPPESIPPDVVKYLDDLVPEWRTLSIEEIRGHLRRRADEILDLINDLERGRERK